MELGMNSTHLALEPRCWITKLCKIINNMVSMCPAGIVANPVCAEGSLVLKLCSVKTTELPLSFQNHFTMEDRKLERSNRDSDYWWTALWRHLFTGHIFVECQPCATTWEVTNQTACFLHVWNVCSPSYDLRPALIQGLGTAFVWCCLFSNAKYPSGLFLICCTLCLPLWDFSLVCSLLPQSLRPLISGTPYPFPCVGSYKLYMMTNVWHAEWRSRRPLPNIVEDWRLGSLQHRLQNLDEEIKAKGQWRWEKSNKTRSICKMPC